MCFCFRVDANLLLNSKQRKMKSLIMHSFDNWSKNLPEKLTIKSRPRPISSSVMLYTVKSVRIRSHCGPYFHAFGLNTGRYLTRWQASEERRLPWEYFENLQKQLTEVSLKKVFLKIFQNSQENVVLRTSF